MFSLSEELKKVPFIKVLVPFILGIIVQMTAIFEWKACLVFLICSSIILIGSSIFKIYRSFAYGYVWGILLTFFLFGFGMFITARQMKMISLPGTLLKSKLFICEISDIPAYNIFWKLDGTITAYEDGKKWEACNCQCKLYVLCDSSKFKINAGDRLLVHAGISSTEWPVCPYQFNFKNYFYYKGIQCQVSAKAGECKKLYVHKTNFSSVVLKIRQALLSKVQDRHMDLREKAVLSSLVLGFTGDIDPELRNSYAVAGVMHILSVSGLHVGIVYGFLMYLFFFMNKSRKLQIARSVIVIICIWFYALVTGFSPPVIRSAAMFSFFAFGQAINRGNNGFNTLAASAFIILLFNPFQLADIGFQLSYTAIAGILLLYGPIYHLWNPSSKYLDGIWALMAVSISAQAGTLPLTLYYFHQFPTYFIFSNLLIVPYSSAIIYAGLLLLIFSFWPIAASSMAILLKYLLLGLNWLVIHVEYLPLASIKGIYLNIPESFLLACIICVVTIWIIDRENAMIFFFLGFLLLFGLSRTIRHISNERNRVLVVHNFPGHSAVSMIFKHNQILLTDSFAIQRINNSSKSMTLAYEIRNSKEFLINKSYKNVDTSIFNVHIYQFAGKNLFIHFHDKKIVFLRDKKILNNNIKSPLPVDYLVVSGKSGFTLPVLKKYFNSGITIFDSSYKQSFQDTIERQERILTNIYFVRERGSFVADL